MKEFVVYLTKYSGSTKLPKWYIGSSFKEKILNKRYNGSVYSKKWKLIYNKEQKENKHLFKTRILSYHLTRKEALKEELRIQKMHIVVKNDNYFNEAYACVNGFFGRDVSGKNNPMYNHKWTKESKNKISKSKNGYKWTDEQKRNHSKRLTGIPKPKKSESMKGKGNSFYGKTHSTKTKQILREKSSDGTRYNIYNLFDENIFENMMKIDVINLSQTLLKKTKENPLGRTKQAQETLIKGGKKQLIGCYVKQIKI